MVLMVVIKASIPEELEARFRKSVALRFGLRRGSLSEAVQEAITLWLQTEEQGVANSGSSENDHTSKDDLVREFPGKFVLLSQGKVAGVGSSVEEAVVSAHGHYPRGTKYSLIHAVPKVSRKAQLGWKVRRRSR
jgi:Arc/MetJ-type ribon-helix-helix transcriptional regulator